jgi:drug/metabolite transporter (DMT)-like permease
MTQLCGLFFSMNFKLINWLLFITLSFIWGSSFILIKVGLEHLSPYQVASIRIISSGIVLLPVALMSFKKIPRNKLLYVFMSGVLGSLVPAYLFCLAEVGIDSALAGTLNALTPIFVIIFGALFFNATTTANKVWGIVLAFSGSLLLFFSQPGFSQNSNVLYILFVVLATALYGINVNMVHKHLSQVGSLHIAAVALSLSAIPALVVLFFTGYFKLNYLDRGILLSTGFASLLGVFGTAISTVFFYILLKRAGAVFASMVTYGIPVIAIGWGIVYGEQIGWKQLLSMLVILSGVWVANRKLNPKVETALVNEVKG